MLHVKNKLEIWQESCSYNIKNLTMYLKRQCQELTIKKYPHLPNVQEYLQ